MYKTTVQDNGQIELPAEWLEKLGVRKGDVITFIEGEDGTLTLIPKRALGVAAMDRIRAELDANGVGPEEFLGEGEKIRQELYDEQFAHKVAGDA